MTTTDYITEYFECECGSEIIAISKWPDRGDTEIFLSMYSIGAGGYRPDWRYRLRYIWYIIRHGHPYSDTIVLSGEEAARLAELLTKIASEET